MKIENIKFKAKKTLDGKWIKGDLVHHKDSDNVWITDYEKRLTSPIDPSTVCQFTGTKDCKGNEIWEHDLLQSKETRAIYEVVWYENGGFVIEDSVGGGCLPTFVGSALRTIEFKVIGNKFDKKKYRMNYKKVLTRYIQGRLSELSNVDAYEPNKLALTNMLWFLGKATSNEVIVAKLKIMVDADIKRKKYLSRYDGNESLYDDEYSKAVSTIGKDCLSYLQNAKNEVQDENKASQ